MPFVLDCSVAIAWHFADERSAVTVRALQNLESDYAIVPVLWHYEIASALMVAVRRKRSAFTSINEHLRLLQTLDIRSAGSPNLDESVALCELAQSSNVSPYDAAYLALAIGHGLPLATIDKKLIAAAQARGTKIYT